ncbi:MAG TPA: formyltransferase family protein, partial [Longimicrobium sp.]|uniref:formyltransferase family protein n=1 Tax=Longimicrobium sp. TaxID=2029185 RepID=UPI002ED88A68
MSRRVVILSPGGAFLNDLLPLLRERGTAVAAVVVYDARLTLPSRGAGRAGRLRALALAPLRGAWRRLRPPVRAAGETIVRTGALNGGGTERALRRLRPDVVVLARCALLQPRLLAIPREGTVNVHPGLLPWIRGNSPVANSLLRGVPLGATAFRVDAGIDTGAVLQRRLVHVAGGETESDLRGALYRLWLQMTADAVQDAVRAPLPPGTPQTDRFPICRDLKGGPEQSLVDEAVCADAARVLLERWRPLCGPAGLTLPADAAG